MAHFHLWLLHRQVQLIQAANATPKMLSAAVQMLQLAASQGAHLADEGYDMSHFEAACTSARERLDAVATERTSAAARALELPALNVSTSPCGPGRYHPPSGTIPVLTPASTDGGDLQAAKKRAALNIGTLALPPANPSFADILKFLDHHTAKQQHAQGRAAQHVLCVVERELFSRAAQGFAACARLLQGEVDELVHIVDKYRRGR